MRKSRFAWFILMVGMTLVFEAVTAQKSPNQLLRGVYLKMMKVKDYSVDASIKADIPLIKILPVNATIYFKQPDKFKVKSKGIAILPRQGFSDFSGMIGDSNSFTAVFTGKENIEKSAVQIISLIPVVDTGELILAKFWVDGKRNLVLKSQLTTRSNGTIQIEYSYFTQETYGLPDNMTFTLDVKKFKMPKAMSPNAKNRGSDSGTKQKEQRKGTIHVALKNYKINQGLKNDFFIK